MNVAVDFKNVDIVFGNEKPRALAMIDTGATRQEILAQTGAVLGCANCNLTIQEGEISVLMGLSGSGKSTLLRAVNLLNVPARGHVFVKQGDKAVDVVSCDAATLRAIRQKQVAMVFQQFALLPWRTVEQNVGFGLELAGVPELGMEPLGVSGLNDEDEDDVDIDFGSLKSDDSDDIDVELN